MKHGIEIPNVMARGELSRLRLIRVDFGECERRGMLVFNLIDNWPGSSRKFSMSCKDARRVAALLRSWGRQRS